MAIYGNPDYFEREAQGTIEQVLVAVRYVGSSRRYSNNSTATQGRWPTNQDFLVDQWHVAFVPESTPDGDPGEGIAWFERSPEFEVEYDPANIAEVMLDRNYVELEPGGPIGEGDSLPGFDRKVRESLGIDDPVDAGTTEVEQLKDLAGVTETVEAETSVDPVDQLVEDYDREELKEEVKDARDDASEFSLRGTSMTEMAEFLVENEHILVKEDRQ